MNSVFVPKEAEVDFLDDDLFGHPEDDDLLVENSNS